MYIWRSIMAAKDIVEVGSRWIIGNGEKVDIWTNRWLSTPDSFKPVSPRIPLEKEKVSCFLDSETWSWNADKVRHSFLPHEAKVILGISISPRLLEDSLIWAWTNNGRFSVKSAYKVAQKWLKNQNIKVDGGGTSDNSWMQTLLKLIWKLNCPN